MSNPNMMSNQNQPQIPNQDAMMMLNMMLSDQIQSQKLDQDAMVTKPKPNLVPDNELPATERFLPIPIFDNSIPGTSTIKSGSLLKYFPKFPLPFSIMLPPIQGLSGTTNVDINNAIPLWVSKRDDGKTLGYYAVNPFTFFG